MKKKYINLNYDKLLAMCLSGELEHEYMTEDDYGLLLDYSTNSFVIDFCTDGLKRLGKYEEYEEFIEQKTAECENKPQAKDGESPERDYSKLTYVELRGMVLRGELEHEYISESVYVYLLENETEFSNEAHQDEESYTAVVDFCTAGLKRFDKYKGLSDFEIYTSFISGQVERKNIEREVLEAFYRPKRRFVSPISVIRVFIEDPKLFARAIGELFVVFYKAHKRVVVAGMVVFSVFTVTLTASALGYNVVDLFRSAFSKSDKTDTDEDGNQIFLAELRFYESIIELLEVENLSILFPAKLPVGYEFTDFIVSERENDTKTQIQAFATEPYISFVVIIDTDSVMESYHYEANGIEYNILDLGNELYQAEWIYSDNYYTVIVSDKAILSEIIENLKEY